MDGTASTWLGRVLAAAHDDLQQGCGLYAFTCRVGPTELHMDALVEHELEGRWSREVADFNRTVPGAAFRIISQSAVICGGFMEHAQRDATVTGHFQESSQRAGIVDSFALFAQDGEGHAICVAGPARETVRVQPRVEGIWKRVGVHLACAMRLRRHLAALDARRDALFDPNGKTAHAEGRVRTDASARESLSIAVRHIERARTARERKNPMKALELWRGLVAGQWSLVDHWERDGRRYLAAYRNRPRLRDPRALTLHERAVLHFAVRGETNKEIAFALGLSETSTAHAVGQIARKLRCRKRSDLIAWREPAGALHERMPVRGGELGVLSVPHSAVGSAAALLSAAERDIADRVVRGHTNAQIAHARGTSTRTIANQMRRIFERLGIHSRTDLVRTLTCG